MSDARVKEMVIAAGLFILALGLRAPGYSFGLPDLFHPDEGNHVQNVKHFIINKTVLQKNWTYTPFLAELCASIRLFASEPVNRTEIIQTGRLISVFSGAATPVVLFLLLRRLVTSLEASVMGFLLSISPLHIEISQYFTSDALLGFLGAFILYFSMEAGKERPGWREVMAGMICALAVATKQNGAMYLAIPLGVVAFSGELRLLPKLKRCLFLSAIFGIGFFMVAPGVFFKWKSGLNMFTRQWKTYSRMKHPGFTSRCVPWDALKAMVVIGIGAVALALVIYGIVQIFRNYRENAFLVSTSLFVGLAVFVVIRQRIFFARNLAWIFPAMLVCAGWGLRHLVVQYRRFSRHPHLLWGGCIVAGVLAAGPQTCLDVRLLSMAMAPDTRNLAAEWLNRQDAPRSAFVFSPVTPKVYEPAGKWRYGYPFVMEKPPGEYRALGARFVIASLSVACRYLKSPETYPKESKKWKEWIDAMKHASKRYKVFEKDYGIIGKLNGTTMDIYHNPPIIIFDLGIPPDGYSEDNTSENMFPAGRFLLKPPHKKQRSPGS